MTVPGTPDPPAGVSAPASQAARRAGQRRERRRRQVRRIAALLGVLLLLAVAFAVWLARDAPDPRPRTAAGPAPWVLADGPRAALGRPV